jgi:ATP-dependent Clp protease ATP-binding subunit ClpC
MGARPLRRAIQRYIEDPLADEVLKAGEMTPGSTVSVDRDKKVEEDDEHPLKLKIVKPRKRPPAKKKKEPVGVGAKGDDEGDSGDEPESSGDGDSKD